MACTPKSSTQENEPHQVYVADDSILWRHDAVGKPQDVSIHSPKSELQPMSDLWEQGYEDGYEDGYFYEDYERHRSDDPDYEDGYEQGFHDGRVESGADGFWDD